jgi:serine phosphatase RsbU (regulator of sigma subunit)/Tfp pilus assembly protein PilF
MKAMQLTEEAMKLAKASGAKYGEGDTYLTLGRIAVAHAEYTQALHNYLSGLQIFESIGSKVGLAKSYNNIAYVYYQQGQFEKVIEYSEKALHIAESSGDKFTVALITNNIGILYKNRGEYEKALEYYFRSLEMKKEVKDKSGSCLTLNNIGVAYHLLNRNADAMDYMQQAQQLAIELNDKGMQSMTYLNMGSIYVGMEQLDKAIISVERSLELSREIGARDRVRESLQGLADIYEEKKDFEKAYQYFRQASAMRDSIYTFESSEQLAEMASKYEADKKQREIELLTERGKVQDLEIQRQNTVRNMMIIGGSISGIFILLIGFMFYGRYKEKQKANTLLSARNIEINRQKNIIEEKNKDITDSIRYAKRIQESILPSSSLLKELLPSSFVLYRPKDIVSGDLYYVDKIPATGEIIFAAIDCTGHGVPGAFVSIVAHNLLDSCIKQKGITQPSLILDEISRGVAATLRRGDKENISKDGMDIALCKLDKTTGRLEYAGAYNPLWIVNANGITEIKADKKPVGESTAYTNHIVQLEKGNRIYIFSDGYADQFGGNDQKKFMSKRFKELIVSLHSKPVNEHGLALEQSFEKWRRHLEQVDDVLVMGVEV